MPTLEDAHGQSLTCSGAAARVAFDTAFSRYLAFRSDAADAVADLIDIDPHCPLAYVLRGEMMLLANDHRLIPAARADAACAIRLAAGASERERAHAAALGHWADGDLDRAMAIWEERVTADPRDILAFRMHHSNAFWLGRRTDMMRLADRIRPHWSADLPAYVAVLACRAFAHEECASHVVAEADGREAVTLDPSDPWAAHAVAHVLEMQGRGDEGVAWLAGLSGRWDKCNSFVHHLWWHMALYHLEAGRFDDVLDLYDRRFRNLEAPLIKALPDLYIDMQNAISMLFRLERQGVDVGGRWEELAEKAANRAGDNTSPFTQVHWLYALARIDRFADLERMLDAMAEHVAANSTTVAPVIEQCALPIGRAIAAAASGDARTAADLMRPVLPRMDRMGGSRAQQAFLDELFLDMAEKAGNSDDRSLILKKAAESHEVPPHGRLGFRDAARAA